MGRLCPSIEDHEWVPDDDGIGYVCQACGVDMEDAAMEHDMADVDDDDDPEPAGCRRVLRRVNVEDMDPEEGAWRRRRAKERGEIWP